MGKLEPAGPKPPWWARAIESPIVGWIWSRLSHWLGDRRRWRDRVAFVLTTLFVVAIAHCFFRVAPIIYRAGAFNDAIGNELNFATFRSDDRIRLNIEEKARTLSVRLQQDKLILRRVGERITCEAEYEQTLRLLGFTTRLKFHAKAERPTFEGAEIIRK